MDVNDDILNMPRGWIIYYNDGSIITEYDRDGNQKNWLATPKKNIKALSLKWGNKFWTIHGKKDYLQKKRAWVTPVIGVPLDPVVEYRYIGYWEGGSKVFYQVNEETGAMKIVVE